MSFAAHVLNRFMADKMPPGKARKVVAAIAWDVIKMPGKECTK